MGIDEAMHNPVWNEATKAEFHRAVKRTRSRRSEYLVSKAKSIISLYGQSVFSDALELLDEAMKHSQGHIQFISATYQKSKFLADTDRIQEAQELLYSAVELAEQNPWGRVSCEIGARVLLIQLLMRTMSVTGLAEARRLLVGTQWNFPGQPELAMEFGLTGSKLFLLLNEPELAASYARIALGPFAYGIPEYLKRLPIRIPSIPADDFDFLVQTSMLDGSDEFAHWQ